MYEPLYATPSDKNYTKIRNTFHNRIIWCKIHNSIGRTIISLYIDSFALITHQNLLLNYPFQPFQLHVNESNYDMTYR